MSLRISNRTKSSTHRITSAIAMRAFGARVAREIYSSFSKGGMATVVALTGDLGAGKTTFAQGFLKALGVKRRIISPTFLIIRPYHLPSTLYPNPYTLVFHIDCYRLRKSQELLSLGLKEILANPRHIVLIEWPELIKKYLPRNTHWITIEHPKKGTHRIVRLL